MSCRLQDPIKDCPYAMNKSMRDDCCVSMGHDPPTIGFGAKGHIQEMRALFQKSTLKEQSKNELP